MSEYTSVSFGGMAQAEADFLSIFSALSGTLSDLQHNLESSLAQWTGAARTSYTQAKADWDAAARHMASVLNSLGGVIGTANDTYQQTERSLTGLWS